MHELHLRYVRWDLSRAILIDPHSNTSIDTLYPQDKTANANAQRRAMVSTSESPPIKEEPIGLSPLLKELMSEYAATGLPPAYFHLSKRNHHEYKNSGFIRPKIQSIYTRRSN